MDTLDLQTVVSGLRETSDKLNELLLSDNNFNNIYGHEIIKIQTLIDQYFLNSFLTLIITSFRY